MQNIKVTIIQSSLHWEDPSRNLLMFSEKITGMDPETDLLVLPEMFTTGFSMNPSKVADPSGEVALEWMRGVASDRKLVVCGSVAVEDSGCFYNRFFWVRPDGSFETYDKIKLFSFAGENNAYTPGTSELIVELKGWRIKPIICYELRFPGLCLNSYQETMGFNYDCLLVVANWPAPRSHAWRVLLMGRAIENQAYVVAVNRLGVDGNGNDHSGDSTVLSPSGESLANLMPNNEGKETINLSRCQLDGFRKQFRFWQDWDRKVKNEARGLDG